jgi:NAD(P)-dependent dehydrogenase (short-subunit alcohol dehydrogenase family)
MTQRLKDKVAVITGAASGIGAATAKRMVEAGAKVVLGDINEERLQTVASEVNGIGIRTDVSNESEIRALIETALSSHGRLDVLHNNAVMSLDDDKTAVTTTDDAWRTTFDVVIMAAAYACRVAIPAMIEGGGGSIVNMSSMAASTASGRIAYGSCKAALETFTLYTAGQYGPQGIRCNAVAPAAVLTEGMKTIFTEEQLAAFGNGIALGHIALPEEIADVVVYLASDDASYISGQVITVNGGGAPAQPW